MPARKKKRSERIDVANIPAGVVGLGLMGRSIVTCLLASGHPVIGITGTKSKLTTTRRQVLALLKELQQEGLLKEKPASVVERLTISTDFAALAKAGVVIESIIESIAAKKKVIRNVEQVVSARALLGTNTSAIPVTQLQEGARHPERILGFHWAEPAHITRFMEIICGKHTRPSAATRAMALAHQWGKEPSLLRRDVRGFITNRCFYALLREAFHLIEAGYATIEDVDRSLRNDLGYWITFAGPFRFMDLTGIPAYRTVMKDLFPDLDCTTKVPKLMKKVVDSGALGVANAKGFYRYTPSQAKRWEKLFLKFTYDIRALAQKYPADLGDRAK
jgi:3-hydroxybutyryl-CoA dehydrogenase